MKTLQDQVAIVTGGNRGIGKCIARKLASAGARVVLVGRAEQELLKTRDELLSEGFEAIAVRADVSDPDQVSSMVETVVQTYGTVNILVNNAGAAGPTLPVDELSPEQWEEVMGSNVTSAYLCTRQVVPVMKKAGGGRIINISSITGKRPMPYRAGYASAKMAIIGFTRTMAMELGEFGITVNAVCPGFVMGERISKVIENQSRMAGRPVQEVEEQFLSASPLRRLVDPEHVADTVLFLTSEAGLSITGEDINVSAGVVMY